MSTSVQRIIGRLGGVLLYRNLSTEDKIRMLEAMKTLEKIRLDGMDWRIEELRKTVKE